MNELEILRQALTDITSMLLEYEDGARSAHFVCGFVDAVACRAIVDADMASERESLRQSIRQSMPN